MAWRRDYEARSPAAARAVAIAILQASSSGFVRGMATAVLTVWASHASRMKRARAWKTGPSELSSTQLSTPERGVYPEPACAAELQKATDSETQEDFPLHSSPSLQLSSQLSSWQGS